MKLSVLRHTLRDGQRAFLVIAGGLVGLVGAAGTVWGSLMGGRVLAAALALWTFGWIFGPIFTGGDETLRPEFFSMLPEKRRLLIGGLLASSFVGVAPLISLLALFSLVVYGARLGISGALVALPAVVLQLAVMVLLARVTVALFGLLLRSLAGAIVGGVLNALVLALAAQGWAVVVAFAPSGGLGWVDGLLRALPSGWGMASIEAAARGDWLMAFVDLAGLAVVVAVLFGGWMLLLPFRTGSTRAQGSARVKLAAHGRLGTAVGKELRSWTRDFLRVGVGTFSLCYGLFFCLLPLAIGWKVELPYAGLIFATMAAATASNLYGTDGTALWAVLLTPGAERADVRARQTAWLLAVGPVALVVTVVMTVISGQTGVWPLVLSLLPAVLGGGAGLVALFSVYALIPGTDPHKRGNNPLSIGEKGGDGIGLVYLLLAAVPLTAGPALLAVVFGSWWGIPAGIATGTLCFWGFGAIAHRRLRARGPEMLNLMRLGGRASASRAISVELPVRQRLLVGLCLGFGAIPLIPQGIVPAILLLSGDHTRSWFLALYAPAGWQWPIALAMVALGSAMYGTGLLLLLRARRRTTAMA